MTAAGPEPPGARARHRHGAENQGIGFRHQALLYEGPDGFLAGVVPFIRAGVEEEAHVLAAVSREKIRALRAEFGAAADEVSFVDIEGVGRNPARIIPVWRRFVDESSGPEPPRGVGEPAWPQRSAAAFAECRRHESLLNLAFAEEPPWQLLCPYDTGALPEEVIAEACQTHPLLTAAEGSRRSASYLSPDVAPDPLQGTLAPPPAGAQRMRFRRPELPRLRRFAAARASALGLSPDRVGDLVVVVNELATNSVIHGHGAGELLLWSEEDDVLCEVRDRGRIDQPLVGRLDPTPMQLGGRGVWLVNQLSDLVQIRSHPEGTAVRVHMSLS